MYFFTNDMAVLRKCADAPRLRGMAETLEERVALQRNLDRPEKWADGNLLEFRFPKCQVQSELPRSS